MNEQIPKHLIHMLNPEKPLFAVKAKRFERLGESVQLIIFSLFWNALAVYMIYTNMMQGNGFSGLLLIMIATGVLVGGIAIRNLFKKGGWFAATQSGLYIEHNGEVVKKPWSEFTGEISIRVKKERGTIKLGLQSKEKGNKKTRNTQIEMVDIPDVYEVSSICRRMVG